MDHSITRLVRLSDVHCTTCILTFTVIWKLNAHNFGPFLYFCSPKIGLINRKSFGPNIITENQTCKILFSNWIWLWVFYYVCIRIVITFWPNWHFFQELRLQTSANISKADLRRTSISLLISMIFLPLHFEVKNTINYFTTL